MVEGDPAIDLAPLDLRGQELAHGRVERAQLVWEAYLDIQIAMVDRTQLDDQRAARQLGGARGETGHAHDHRLGFRGFSTGKKRQKLNEIFTLCVTLPRM